MPETITSLSFSGYENVIGIAKRKDVAGIINVISLLTSISSFPDGSDIPAFNFSERPFPAQCPPQNFAGVGAGGGGWRGVDGGPLPPSLIFWRRWSGPPRPRLPRFPSGKGGRFGQVSKKFRVWFLAKIFFGTFGAEEALKGGGVPPPPPV